MPPRLVNDGVRTHVIAAQDLILIVPLGLLIIHLIRQGERTGYVLAPILYVKGVTLAVSVLGMIVFMVMAGTPPELPEVGMFVLLTTVFSFATFLYLNSLYWPEGGEVVEEIGNLTPYDVERSISKSPLDSKRYSGK